jgi:hypothetical protein
MQVACLQLAGDEAINGGHLAIGVFKSNALRCFASDTEMAPDYCTDVIQTFDSERVPEDFYLVGNLLDICCQTGNKIIKVCPDFAGS